MRSWYVCWFGRVGFDRNRQRRNEYPLSIVKIHWWVSTTCFGLILVSGIFMFPYEHFWNANTEKHNQSSSTSECVVHETDALSSSCLFTLVFYYILPLSIIGLCYLRVSMHIRRTGYCMVKRTVSSSLASKVLIVREDVSRDKARWRERNVNKKSEK